MAFLTKKEQTLINLLCVNPDLSQQEKDEKIKAIKRTARLRQDGYRKPVKIFFGVLSSHNTGKMLNELIKYHG